MKLRFPILLLFILPAFCYSQSGIGSWKDYLSFNSSKWMATGDNKLFSSAGNGILIRDVQNNSTGKFTRLNGLNETEISSIAWSSDEESLVIGYKNTNIDIVKNNTVSNIPDIWQKYIAGLKEINRIRTNGKYAYLACSFGIVILDLRNLVIADTWKPGSDSNVNSVYDVAFLNDRIYAATGTGVYYASLSSPGLSYFDNWDKVSSVPYPDAVYSNISADGNFIYASCPSVISGTDLLYKISASGSSQLLYSEDNRTIRSVEAGSNGILVTTDSPVLLLSSDGSRLKTISSYPWGTPNANQAVFFMGSTWIADESVGLIETPDFSSFSNYSLPGPYTNNVADIVIRDNKAFTTGGGVTNAWGNIYRPLQVFNLSGEEWNNQILYGSGDRDALRVAVDPSNSNHYFVSSWGNGVYEFLDGAMVKNYNQYNSPLTSIYPNSPYCRVCGMAFDREDNLWVVQSGVSRNLKMLKPDGTWVTAPLTLSAPIGGDIIIAENGFLWITLPEGYGVLVYDPAGTPDNTDDDRYTILQVEDATGTVLNQVSSIAEDLDGNIWIGTDAGPVVYYTPEKAFSSDIRVIRIKIPRNDGSGLADYLLSTETITSIAIDGANRKWFGTLNSGVYYVSEDCLTQLKSFKMADSPLISDHIVKIAVNQDNGEVWFGTAAGIVSYRGTATAGGASYSGLYVFPNPVREDFGGVVTVTGLVENSTVKITDVSGNLVYEGTSTGGQLTWDMNNYKGRRVNTGVYLVFCSNSDGSLSAVTKMLIIK